MRVPLIAAALALSLLVPAGMLRGEEEVPLFNGKDLSGWTNAAGAPVTAGWIVEKDGVLHRAGKGGGDLYTAKEYGDFELKFEWKIAPGGNSGVKYRMKEYPGKGNLGFEYQLLDDAKHPDSKVGPHRQAASLYDLIPPDAATKKLNPPGEWNTAVIRVAGTRITHWINGAKVVDIETNSDAWKAAHARGKFKGVADFGQNLTGRILLQDHGDEVWFRRITIVAR